MEERKQKKKKRNPLNNVINAMTLPEDEGFENQASRKFSNPLKVGFWL